MPDTGDGRRGTLAGGLALTAAAVMISLAAAEAGTRLLAPQPDPYLRQKVNPATLARYVPSAFPPGTELRMRTEPGLPGMEPRVRVFSVNNLGFRGDSLHRPKPADEYRIFMVGGSTTECLYLGDDQAVTHILQERLNDALPSGPRVAVYGAGKSGDKSFDHIAMVAHRILHLEPDLIVVFAGFNDLLFSMRGDDYLLYPYRPQGAPERWSLSHLLRFTSTEFHVPRLVYSALRPLRPSHPETIYTTSNYRQLARDSRRSPMLEHPPRVDLEPYAENLRSLAGMVRANGTNIVFMTQATTWNSEIDPDASRWHWITGFGGRHPEPALDSALESYNDVTRAVALEAGSPLFDLPHHLPKSLEFFYDDVHFNLRGADVAGTALARFLVEEGIVR